jgi:hypothetical protein
MRPAKPGVSSGQGPPLSSPAGRRPRPTSGYDIGDLTGRREDEAQNSNRKAGSDSIQNCEHAMEHSVARARYDRPATLATGWTLAPSKGSLAEQSTRELTQVNEPGRSALDAGLPAVCLPSRFGQPQVLRAVALFQKGKRPRCRMHRGLKLDLSHISDVSPILVNPSYELDLYLLVPLILVLTICSSSARTHAQTR